MEGFGRLRPIPARQGQRRTGTDLVQLWLPGSQLLFPENAVREGWPGEPNNLLSHRCGSILRRWSLFMEPLESFAREWGEMKARVERLERELADRSTAPGLDHRPMRTREFAATFPEWTEGRLRKRLFHRSTNGLLKSGAVVDRNDGVYIIPDEFFAWLRGQRPVRRR